MRAGWLGVLVLIAITTAYEGSKEPDAAFDTKIRQLYKSSCGTKIIIEMQQAVPFEYTYHQRQIPYSYRMLFECVNSKILRFYLVDSVHPVFRMEESDPFPNIFNLQEQMQDSIHEYHKVPFEQELKLPYCQGEVFIHQRSCYVQIEITHRGNTVKFLGFRVEKRMLFFHMKLPTDYLLGLGERNGKFKIDTGKYTLWAKDNLFAVQREEFCQNTYGYHPMILYRDRHCKDYELLYIRSSSALEIEIQNQNDDKLLLVELHGNSLEMMFFQNQTAKGALEMYHEYIGTFKLPPLWFFGFHQSRWGYSSASQLQKVIDGYRDADLKLESIFLDIDYMVNKKPFKIDITNFPLLELMSIKKKQGIKLVPIVDYAFNYDFESDIDFDLRSQINSTTRIQNLFIKNYEGNLCIGQVWPGVSIFPDFYHPHIQNLWKPYLSFLREHIPFDGIWLDMNEIANFHKNPLQHIDYKDTYLECGELLSNMTLPISAMHYNEQPEFYMHNINGIKQQQITSSIAKSIFGKEFYFISRNTFPGSGKYGGHWSGDNQAKWEYLDYSVTSLLNFNLFGIPFSGSDVCGFFGNYEQKLCSKWIQVNTFFPLFRNHNHINFKDQQFFKIGDIVSKTIKMAMDFRYSLLKYIYNVFVQRDGKGVVYYPMVFDFPDNYDILSESRYIENQVMIGPNMMFSSKDQVYLPDNITWFIYRLEFPAAVFHGGKRHIKLESKEAQQQNLLIKGGTITLDQNTKNVTKVSELGNKYTLRCFMNQQNLCQTIYHDQASRVAGLCNKSADCSYRILGNVTMLPKLPNITHIEFKVINVKPHTSIFKLYITEIRIIGWHLLKASPEDCLAKQIMDPYTKQRKCHVDQYFTYLTIRKKDSKIPYTLSEVKALSFQFI